MKIVTKKIISEDFRPFGKALVGASGAPTSQSAEYKFWSDIINYHIDGETEIGICRVYKQDPAAVKVFERHLKTPEILIPIDAPFIIPLIEDKNKPESIKAFIVEVGQAVVIDKEIWHAACIPFEKKEASYFVIFKRGTPTNDVEKTELSELAVLD